MDKHDYLVDNEDSKSSVENGLLIGKGINPLRS